MYIYNSIPHITNTLNLGKDLLEVLFEKRKSLPFRYDYALDIIDENKLNILFEREVIRRNGPYIEMDEHYLSFYELLLEANEEISTSVIDENIQLVYQLIDYYGRRITICVSWVICDRSRRICGRSGRSWYVTWCPCNG